MKTTIYGVYMKSLDRMYALAEDGRLLVGKPVPNEPPQDMLGYLSTTSREAFELACPDGYDLQWIASPYSHKGFLRALFCPDKCPFLADLGEEVEG